MERRPTLGHTTAHLPVAAERRVAGASAAIAPVARITDRCADELHVEDLDAARAAGCLQAWRDLAADCLEPNAFYEPDFVLAAAAALQPRLRFVVVWSGRAGHHRRLLAVVPLRLPHPAAPLPIGWLWLHKNATCATPWLDRARAAPAFDAVLAHCRRTWPGMVGLGIEGVRLDGLFVRLLRTTHLRLRATGGFRRAVLASTRDGGTRPVTSSHRTLRKCRRRLERLGPLVLRTASSSDDVEAALKVFLAIEAGGWKGGRGALAGTPSLAAFARAATLGLAESGRCRIVALELERRAIAMGIVLISAKRAYFWKIAYDEAYAAYSPGALLGLELTQALGRDPTVESADSCADADHPMIDKLWSDRVEIGTCFVALRGPFRFALAVARDVFRLQARQRLKAALKRIRRAQRSGLR